MGGGGGYQPGVIYNEGVSIASPFCLLCHFKLETEQHFLSNARLERRSRQGDRGVNLRLHLDYLGI